MSRRLRNGPRLGVDFGPAIARCASARARCRGPSPTLPRRHRSFLGPRDPLRRSIAVRAPTAVPRSLRFTHPPSHKDLRPVHSNPLAFAAALCLAAFLTEAAHASPEHDALVYLDAQVLPKKAVACSSRIAGYTARFEPAFRTWLARNKDNVASGEAFLRAEAERTKVA